MNLSTRTSAITLAIALLLTGCGGGGGGNAGGPTPNVPGSSGAAAAPVVAGVASFAGSRGTYNITRVASTYTVAERDTHVLASVAGASAIRFSDITINLTIGDKGLALGTAGLKSLIELYIASLNRMPDADSLSAWIGQLQAGQTMTVVADKLHAEAVLSPGLTGYSPTMLNDEFVKAVYKNVFGLSGAAAPTQGAVEAWSVRIDKGGISRGALILAMLEAARSKSADLSAASIIPLLDNKFLVGDFFALQQGINYNSAAESADRTTAIKSAVTSADITTALGLIGFSDPSFSLITIK